MGENKILLQISGPYNGVKVTPCGNSLKSQIDL